MEQILSQLIGGAVGGLGGGKVVKDADMGNIGNLIAGALGGIGGGQLIGGLLGSGTDIAALAGNLVGGGVAGLIVQVVVGLVVKKLRG
ncbi:MAG: hypothetical protein H6897_05470 [Rhodobacteraceae bacterium]|jgi:hypothetical protein|uniref:hypothetical protein n=1 Tax=Albidovulum sp. TaxID=1872424 RepID=UPI001DEE741D|nr:hypothetical protein [uncultured Defluviimonas sp.]MCB2124860.1 hypothetical protein [Paracoccaceae bacterium]MCC0069364.1 hypothetical protein [Paracoccaceae bacterium]